VEIGARDGKLYFPVEIPMEYVLGLGSSGMLCGISWSLITDVLGQHVGHSVQEENTSWTNLPDNWPVSCPKISVTNHKPKLCNTTKAKDTTTLPEISHTHYKIECKEMG
jgi:hypothetical protein